MTTKKEAPPKMTLEEIRAALDGEEKEVFLKLSNSQWDTPGFLKGKTPDEITNYLKGVATEANFPEGFKLDQRSIPITKARREYTYGKGYQTKVSTRKEGPYWVLVGYEPYSDEELQEKGAKLVAAKKKRDEAAAKKLKKQVDAFNAKARELGQPTITIEDVSK